MNCERVDTCRQHLLDATPCLRRDVVAMDGHSFAITMVAGASMNSKVIPLPSGAKGLAKELTNRRTLYPERHPAHEDEAQDQSAGKR